MAESTKSFGESLAAEVRAGRSFGGHPLWFKIQEGRLARPQVQGFAKQFFLQVLEFPRAVSALHSRCTDMGERVKLAESVYEEETGRLSGSKAHPELFLDFATGLGLPRHQVLTATALPSTAAPLAPSRAGSRSTMAWTRRRSPSGTCTSSPMPSTPMSATTS